MFLITLFWNIFFTGKEELFNPLCAADTRTAAY